MRRHNLGRGFLQCALAAGLVQCPAVFAADDDALALEGATAESAPAAAQQTVAVEVGLARLTRNQGLGSDVGGKFAIDFRRRGSLGESLNYTVSDRFEALHVPDYPLRTVTNSFREGFVTYVRGANGPTMDFGRVNLRQGPALGFNPTDYFRQGAWRTQSSADPVAMRGYRMGTVMARITLGGEGGATSLVLAPKLSSEASDGRFSLDLGATNHAHRGALIQTFKLGSVNLQGSVLAEAGAGPTVGLSASAVASDALVGFAEWASRRSTRLLDEALGQSASAVRRNQFSVGATYTFGDQTSLTLEYEYNGRGLDAAQWDQLFLQGGYLAYAHLMAQAQSSQELTQKSALLLHVTRSNLLMRNLDVSALLRLNSSDKSRFGWVEARYHWGAADVVLQIQRGSGPDRSEFGSAPYTTVAQLTGIWHF